MGETFTHYARRMAAMCQHGRLTVEQAAVEARPLRATTRQLDREEPYMTTPAPDYVKQLLDALAAAGDSIELRAGQREADWLVAAHANRRTVLVECLPTGYDVRADDTYLDTKVDLDEAVRTVRRTLTRPPDGGEPPRSYQAALPASFPHGVAGPPESIRDMVAALLDPARADVPQGSSFAVTVDNSDGTWNLWLSQASFGYLTATRVLPSTEEPDEHPPPPHR